MSERSATADVWEPNGRIAAVLLLIILAVAVLLRLPTLGQQSLWLDEAISWQQSNTTIRHLLSVTAADNYPPLHNLLLWGMIRLFGDGETALRLPSAVAGVLNVAAMYWVGRLLGGRGAGLLAALLLALSGFHVFYSQDARQYALLGLFATLFAGASIRFAEKPDPLWGLLSVAAGTALVYSHYYGVLGWLAVASGSGLAMLSSLPRRKLWKWVIVQAGIAALFSPWLLIFVRRARSVAHQGFWIPQPAFGTIFDDFTRFTAGQLGVLLLGIALGIVMLGARNRRAWIVWSWAVLPIGLGILAAVLVQPIFTARYAMVSLPAIIAAASAGFAAISVRRSLLVAVAVALSISSVLTIARQYGAREDWRSVAAAVKRDIKPDDCLVISMNYFASPMAYYDRTPQTCFSSIYQLSDLQPAQYRRHRIFLVLKDVPADLRVAIIAQITANHRESAAASFGGNIDLMTFDGLQPAAASSAAVP